MRESECSERCNCHEEVFIEKVSGKNILYCRFQNVDSESDVSRRIQSYRKRKKSRQMMNCQSSREQNNSCDKRDKLSFFCAVRMLV